MPESITEFVARQRAERTAAGMAETITDTDTLRVIAAVVTASSPRPLGEVVRDGRAA